MNLHSRWLAFGILTVVMGNFVAPAAEKLPKPNVILVMTDDQGYGDLSCHGNPVLKTPHLDRLHAQSVRLTDFHAAPMCTATRGQLMTGVDALRNGAMNVSSGRTLLRREFPTMAEIFLSNGYGTALFGKWHLGDNYPYRPQDRGFQESIWMPSSHTPSVPDFWNNDYFDDVYNHNGKRRQFSGYCTDVFFREAMNWMRDCARQQKPFFCYVPLNAPHAPLFAPEKYREAYASEKPSVARFYGMLANFDENMGKLMAFLEQSGLAENTVLIFMTDNGSANRQSDFNAGMRGRKIELYDGGHRVPFFLRWPAGKLRAPGDIDVLTQSQDVLPTLIDLCRLRKPRRAAFDGVSLASLFCDQTETLPDRMCVVQFSRMDMPQPWHNDAAVLWKKWRLLNGNELYNITTDPAQQKNVFEAHPDIAKRMQQHYDAWWKKVEPRVNEFSPVHIGSKNENFTMLTPCEWRDVFLDQQAQVRRIQRNGVWTLYVESSGDYEISLRRWPRESNLALTQAAPEYQGVDGVYQAGAALPIAQAELKIGGQQKSKRAQPSDQEITFSIPLKRGPTNLQTFFRDAGGKELCGAYYVYVRGPQK